MNVNNELNKLLRQKGVFPYDFYDSNDKLNYIGLNTTLIQSGIQLKIFMIRN